jgi:uncharacterized membrane protein YfcA
MMNLEWYEYLLVLIGSFIAGSINTLAGNGSVITLSLLTDSVGLPPNVANGTNRIGLLLQSAGSSKGFAQNASANFNGATHIIVLMIIGAIAGVIVATQVSNEQFMFVFKYLMVGMLILVLVKPERWIKESTVKTLPKWQSYPIFLVLGFYGGFIQMGMGIFFVAVLVLMSGYNIIAANAIKTVVVMIYTVIVLAIFAYKGLVDWQTGFILAIGQTFGGYLTALYAPRFPNINIWAYRLLIAIIVIAIITQFGMIKL